MWLLCVETAFTFKPQHFAHAVCTILVLISYDSHNKHPFSWTALIGHSFLQRGFCDAGSEFVRIKRMSFMLQTSRFPKTEEPLAVGRTGNVRSCCHIQTMTVCSR